MRLNKKQEGLLPWVHMVEKRGEDKKLTSRSHRSRCMAKYRSSGPNSKEIYASIHFYGCDKEELSEQIVVYLHSLA